MRNFRGHVRTQGTTSGSDVIFSSGSSSANTNWAVPIYYWRRLKYTSVTSLDVDLRKWKTAIYLRIGPWFEDWTSYIYIQESPTRRSSARVDKSSINALSSSSKQPLPEILRGLTLPSGTPEGTFYPYFKLSFYMTTKITSGINVIKNDMLTSSAVDHKFKLQSGQTIDYKIDISSICSFFAKHAALRTG